MPRFAAHLIAVKGTHQFHHYDPDDPESLYLMGRMNQCGGSPEIARTIFRKILEKYPDHAVRRRHSRSLARSRGKAFAGKLIEHADVLCECFAPTARRGVGA